MNFLIQLLCGLYWGTVIGLLLVGIGMQIPWAFFVGCIGTLLGVAWVAYRNTDDTYYGSDGYV